MSVKSTTQMTKAELLEVINDKNIIIAELNEKIDELSAISKLNVNATVEPSAV